MKNIKEKEQLIKMSLALGMEPDPKIVKEVLEYKQMMADIKKTSAEVLEVFEVISKLKEEDVLPKKEELEIPKPPSLEEITLFLEELQTHELVEVPKPPTLDEVLEQFESFDIEEPVEEKLEKTLVDLAASHITKEVMNEQKAATTFEQPDVPLPQTIGELKRKVKMLEDWLAKVSLAGPGSGEVNLLNLDDVDVSNIGDNRFLRFNAANNKIEFAATGGGGGVVDSVNGLTGDVVLTTANVNEDINLYFTNNRADARVFPAFEQANIATINASSAFDQANTATTYSLSAFDQANIAIGFSSSAFDQANIATINASSAFDAANTKTIAADLTTANVVELTNLYFTNARAIASLIDESVTIGEVTITGNLIVLGNVVEFNTETLTIEDKNIVLANGSPTAAASDGAGITVDGSNATLLYLSDGDKWQFNKDLDVSGSINASGQITSPFFYSESDVTLKENIKPLSGALNKVLRLFGVIFNWKSNKTKSIGLIAQDVEKVVPEIIGRSGSGFKTVQYDSLIPLLIEAIKEQQIQIDELRKKIK